jgi:small conductance mechanosensitive channel
MEILNDLLAALVALVPRIAGSIAVLMFGFPIVNFIMNRISRQIEKRSPQLDTDVRAFLDRTLSLLLKVLVVITAIAILGVQTTSLAAAIGALGFAVGLALQGALGNLAAGILVLVFKPYSSGDWITAQGYSGTVQSIQLFSTIILTYDNHRVIIPNGSVVSGAIENFSLESVRRHNMIFGIGYQDNIAQARQILTDTVRKCPGFIEDRGLEVHVNELAESSVNFTVRFWTSNENFFPAKFYMQEQVKLAFDEQGIHIPFPQMEVTMAEAPAGS